MPEITEVIKLVGGGGVLITILVGVLRLGRLMEKVDAVTKGQAKLEADIETVRTDGMQTRGIVMELKGQLMGILMAPAPASEGTTMKERWKK